ncbi:hypothetical protein P168DRAFT_303380 [Aspergillus campestris IBT 28561]|uniref:Mitochondrial fission process protein 1 n=1 Tax=Aspergillus campestris (strain IBT 28561) TaxID=1392248 RepID=A0A2I1D6Y8_ASPC2|nr:uncharacterized protein P168DRAFT_303380 [Aspergillus campestris IBT 28561]PKY05623.1 hypothetical protein P168DRAFT_303380 [Aspergillus campestris IBT 28561]
MLWNSPNEETPPEDPKPIPREKLSPQLQQLVDHDDRTFYDDIYGPYSIDSTDTPYRYAGYANRLRTILLSAHRYVAYTSDIGESFRPVSHPYLVRSAYAISWTYLIGDVAHEGYKAYLRNRDVLAPPCESYKDAVSHGDVVLGMATGNVAGSLRPSQSLSGAQSQSQAEQESLTPWPATSIPLIEDYRVVMAKRAVFQGLASMGLPALTIHTVVKHSGRMLKDYKSALLRTWSPIGLGLAIVPFLPYIFDEPVEHAVQWSFREAIRAYAGDDAVRALPPAPHTPDKDSTTLVRLLHVEQEKNNHGNGGSAASDSASVSWEEYKAEKKRAKEHRMSMREREGVVVRGNIY